VNLILILYILAFLFLLWAVIAIIRKIVKWAVILGLIGLVIWLFTSGAISTDQQQFVQSVENERQLIMLEDKAAYLTNPIEYVSPKNPPPASRIVRVSVEALDFDVTINNKKIRSDEIQELYLEGKPLSQITYADIALDAKFPETGTLKQGVFAYIYEKELKPTTNPLRFSERYKKGLITVEPESPFFQAARILPAAWIEQKLNKAREGISTITANILKEVKAWVSSES